MYQNYNVYAVCAFAAVGKSEASFLIRPKTQILAPARQF